MKNKLLINRFLITISLALSITAMTLMIVESRNFTNENIAQEKIKTIDNNNINIQNNNNKEIVNAIIKQIENEKMPDTTKTLSLKNEQINKKNEEDNKQQNNTNRVNNYYILVSSFVEKDNAILALSKIRITHSDLTKKYATSVRKFTKNNHQVYGIFFKTKNQQDSQDLCLIVQSRGMECEVVTSDESEK